MKKLDKQAFEFTIHKKSMAAKMNKIKQTFGVSEALWGRWQKWLADESMWPTHSSFIHGDLHPAHILVTPDGRVTGLLDWTEGEVADPATDFVIFYFLFGEEKLAEMIKLYEQAGGKTCPRMQEHIIELSSAYPIAVALFAERSGLEDYYAMARAGFGVDEHGNELSTD
ncbi:phosphotransferase [Paenibacillus radicibacter]|uniref:phosphotransferase n=1 Tax=Paenibacillus radicibacter TaxID=2972488 RepID=UPI00280BBA69|nr:phosphotransferase [Paenibacillus radicibacter]